MLNSINIPLDTTLKFNLSECLITKYNSLNNVKTRVIKNMPHIIKKYIQFPLSKGPKNFVTKFDIILYTKFYFL